MIAVELGQSATRLLQALEKLGQSAGSGLQSGGPSGKPSDELIKTFQEAMDELKRASGATAAGAIAQGADLLPGPAASMPSVDEVNKAAKVTETANNKPEFIMEFQVEPSTGTVGSLTDNIRAGNPQGVADPLHNQGNNQVNGADGNTPKTPDDNFKEMARLLENISRPGASLNPSDVYRLQYLVGMLKMQAQTGLKASQSTTQGLESVLRQSG